MDQKQRTLRLIKEGQSSDYWRLIKSEIEKLSEWEKNYRQGFNLRGLKDSEVHLFNDSILREKCFEMVLGINERLLEENKSVAEKIVNTISKANTRVNSFINILKK